MRKLPPQKNPRAREVVAIRAMMNKVARSTPLAPARTPERWLFRSFSFGLLPGTFEQDHRTFVFSYAIVF
jgi:hypothetical protein